MIRVQIPYFTPRLMHLHETWEMPIMTGRIIMESTRFDHARYREHLQKSHHIENFCKTEQMDETYVESVITHSETLRRAQDATRLFRTIFQILRKLFSKGSAKQENVRKTA
jgi:hypothetical protein